MEPPPSAASVHPSRHPNPQPPPPAAFAHPSRHPNPQPPPPPPSLPTVLSDLKSLLDLSAAALRSLPIPTAAAAASSLLPCPFNPNHRLPPSALFSHYLNCPTPFSLPHSCHYPLTLRSAGDGVAPPILSTSSDLSISLEKHAGYKAPVDSFFYQDCPGPVTPSTEPPPLLVLPRDLCSECAEIGNGSTLKSVSSFSLDFIRFLPSEIWAIRNETQSWGCGFPAAYSSRILRAILRLSGCKLMRLCEWIVANSPRFGVIVDFSMRDHMVLLIRLCLKAVIKEALGLVGVMSKDGELSLEENVLQGLSSRNFSCPILGKVMMWLSLQFSILYGEVNGKFFTVEVLKECILDSALCASLFPLERKGSGQSDFAEVACQVQEPLQSADLAGDTAGNEQENTMNETVGKSVICVARVAAAVAALHERAFIEEKIKALRDSRPLSAFQRNMEHDHVSKIANEERKKRPNYRPIIDHDGFLWQRSTNQDTNKVKTKEQLLAEERDYKRRRMSYRGKKVKRNTTEVMRDIIKEYMEDIKHAGGVSDMSKAGEESESLASEDMNTHASSTQKSESRGNSEMPMVNRHQLLDYKELLHTQRDSESPAEEIMRPRGDSSWDHMHKKFNTRYRHDSSDYLGSRDGRQSSSHSREGMLDRETQEYAEAREGSSRRSSRRSREPHERTRHKYIEEHGWSYYRSEKEDHERTMRKRESSQEYREHVDRVKTKTDRAHQERDEDYRGYRDRKGGKTKSRISHAELQKFEDRYDPAESHDCYNDKS